MGVVLLKETGFPERESACFCGSTDLVEKDFADFADKAASAGLLFDTKGDGDELLEDTDWLRSDSTVTKDEDYNEMFDQDPGQNGPS